MSLLDKATQVVGATQLTELQQQQAKDNEVRDRLAKEIEDRTGFTPLFVGIRDPERPYWGHEQWSGKVVRWQTYREFLFDVDGSKIAVQKSDTWFLEVPCKRTCGRQALIPVTYYGNRDVPLEQKREGFIAHVAKMLTQMAAVFGECAWCKTSVEDYCPSCGRGNR